MGYYINVVNHDVLIPNDKKVAALDAIKAMATSTNKMGGGGYTGGEVVERWFSWVDMTQLANADTLVEAFDAWRYIFTETDEGVRLEYFNGEKLGDDAFLWETMSPFINDGSIEVHGEEGEFWRWKFKDGTYNEVQLRLVEV